MACIKNFITFLSLFCFHLIFSQEIQLDLDSLENEVHEIYKSHPDQAIELGNLILKSTQSDEQKSRIFGSIAVSYFVKNDIEKSTELLYEAKKYAEKCGNPELIAQMYGSLGHQFIQLNLQDKSRFYLNKAIEKTKELPPGNNKKFYNALAYLDLGNLEFDKKSYHQALVFYEKSMNEFDRMIEPGTKYDYHYQRSLYNIGNTFFSLNNLDSANYYLNEALKIQENSNDLKPFIYSTLSEIYTKRKEFRSSIDSLQIVLNDSRFDNDKLRSEIYNHLAENYLQINDKENYFLFKEKHENLEESLKSNDFQAINTAMNAEQRSFDSALSNSKKSNRNLRLVILIVVVILLSLMFIFYLKRRKEKEQFRKIITDLEAKLKTENTEKSSQIKPQSESKPEPNPTEKELLHKLEKFENSRKFTHPDLNISVLAVQLKTNTTYLSEVINRFKNQNFNSYLNELRINYICNKIYSQPEYLHYKISYLAEESGFSSHSAFATVFKNITGISPSAFIREAAKNESYKPKQKKHNKLIE